MTRRTNPKQAEALKVLTDNENKIIVYGGGAGGGKSWLGCAWLLLMSTSFAGTRWYIGREELKRIRQSTFITWAKVCKEYNFTAWSFNGQDNYIKLENGSQIDLLDLAVMPSDPLFERLGSLEYTGGWIEEGGEIDEGAFEVIRSRAGRHMNVEYNLLSKTLITCNPKKNWLYKDFYKPFTEGRLPKGSIFVQALVQDNPYISEDYINNLRSLDNEARKQRLLFGNWDYDEDPTALLDYDTISRFVRATKRKPKEGEKYITADVALRSDKFVCLVWQGWHVIDHVIMSKLSSKELAGHIKAMASKHGVKVENIAYDADGIGDYLTAYFPKSFGFKAQRRPFVEKGRAVNYASLKAQVHFYACGKIKAGEARSYQGFGEHTEDLKQELAWIKLASVDDDRKVDILSKKEVKKALGHSPDITDAIVMRAVFDLKPKKRFFVI